MGLGNMDPYMQLLQQLYTQQIQQQQIQQQQIKSKQKQQMSRIQTSGTPNNHNWEALRDELDYGVPLGESFMSEGLHDRYVREGVMG